MHHTSSLFPITTAASAAVVGPTLSPTKHLSPPLPIATTKHTSTPPPPPTETPTGDGANDVAMIQEAQIGVGISGKEGKQAR